MIPHNVDANITMRQGTEQDFTMPADLVITNARGRWFATAKSVPGLYVSGETEADVCRQIPDAVRTLELFRQDWFEQVRV